MDRQSVDLTEWVSIHDRTKKMPVRQDFYVLFDNGEVCRHYDDKHPKALATHWKPLISNTAPPVTT